MVLKWDLLSLSLFLLLSQSLSPPFSLSLSFSPFLTLFFSPFLFLSPLSLSLFFPLNFHPYSLTLFSPSLFLPSLSSSLPLFLSYSYPLLPPPVYPTQQGTSHTSPRRLVLSCSYFTWVFIYHSQRPIFTCCFQVPNRTTEANGSSLRFREPTGIWNRCSIPGPQVT